MKFNNSETGAYALIVCHYNLSQVLEKRRIYEHIGINEDIIMNHFSNPIKIYHNFQNISLRHHLQNVKAHSRPI